MQSGGKGRRESGTGEGGTSTLKANADLMCAVGENASWKRRGSRGRIFGDELVVVDQNNQQTNE